MRNIFLITICTIFVAILLFIIFKKLKDNYEYPSNQLYSVQVNKNPPVKSSSVNTNNLVVDSQGNISTSASVPIGAIVMWSGLATAPNIPPGWALCDGTNNTPDLRSRFIVGAQGDNKVTGNQLTGYNPGDNGGEEFHQLTIAEMPAHTHGIYGLGGDGGVYATYNASGDQQPGGTAATVAGGDKNNNYATLPHNNMPPFYALAFIIKIA